MEKRRAVIITTQHKGVFFGYLDQDTAAPPAAVTLNQARMCVYWSADVQGLLGLASSGPSKACRITPAAPAVTLYDVTAIIDVAPDAEARWTEAPWSK